MDDYDDLHCVLIEAAVRVYDDCGHALPVSVARAQRVRKRAGRWRHSVTDWKASQCEHES